MPNLGKYGIIGLGGLIVSIAIFVILSSILNLNTGEQDTQIHSLKPVSQSFDLSDRQKTALGHDSLLVSLFEEPWVPPIEAPYHKVICDYPIIENINKKYTRPALDLPLPEFDPVEISLPNNHSPHKCFYGHRTFSPYLSGKIQKSGSCRFEIQKTDAGLYGGLSWIECSDDAFEEVSRKNIQKTYANNKDPECIPVTSKMTYRLLDEDGNIIPE